MSSRKLDRSLSIIWANVLSIVFAVPVLLVFVPLFLLIHDYDSLSAGTTFIYSNPLLFLALFIGGIVLHEALHGLTWQILSGQRDVVEYGVKWKVLTPYAHMKARIPISAYRTGIWMPGFVVGLIPVLVALLIGNGTLLWFGILFVWGAGGDMMILWLLRGIPDTAEIEDHPERVGCYVWLLEESAEETPV